MKRERERQKATERHLAGIAIRFGSIKMQLQLQLHVQLLLLLLLPLLLQFQLHLQQQQQQQQSHANANANANAERGCTCFDAITSCRGNSSTLLDVWHAASAAIFQLVEID